ncbi:MAG3720 family protein [Mycoplasma hafezii]|uniref:MAG3720 family protein n=1 Tax=Mycoplasma hafezii TaxID=525886 RepID=UPI003CEDE8A4
MLKYYLNIHLVNRNLVKVALLKAEQNNFLNGGANFSFKWNSGSDKTKQESFSKLEKTLNKLPENSHLITNVILDDSIFDDLLVTKSVTKLSKNELNYETFDAKEIQRFLQSRMESINIVDDSKFYVHYTYMYTIEEKDKLKGDVLKVYKNFPNNKSFDVLSQHSTIYQFSKNNLTFIKLQHFLLKFNLQNDINYFFRSQVIANSLRDQKKLTFLVDLSNDYLLMSTVLFGKVVDYKKLAVGTAGLIEKIKRVTGLRTDEIMSRFNYIDRYTNNKLTKYETDNNLIHFKRALDVLVDRINTVIKLQIAHLCDVNGGKIITKIAFSGELAWLVEYLMHHFNSKNEYELMKITDSNKFSFTYLTDKMVERTILMLEGDEKQEQAQTQTNQVYLQKNSKYTLFSKIKEFLYKGA